MKEEYAELQKQLTESRIAHESALQRLRRMEESFERFVPRQFLNLMDFREIRDVHLGAQTERPLTILFTDIREFTRLSESISPQENFNFLNSYLSQMQPVIGAYGGLIDKYVGDAILALYPESPDDALHSASAMLKQLTIYNTGRARAGYEPVRIGIGINTGFVMLGTIGSASRMDVSVIGDAVNLAARIEHLTREWDIALLITEQTHAHLADPDFFHIRFLDRLQVRGREQTQAVFEVFDADPPPLRAAKRAHMNLFLDAQAALHFGQYDLAAETIGRYLTHVPDDKPAQHIKEIINNKINASADPIDIARPWESTDSSGLKTDTMLAHCLTVVNALTNALATGNRDGTSFIDQIQGLLGDIHAIELDIMKETEYPFITSHTREHACIHMSCQHLREILTQTEISPLQLALRCQVFIADRIISHSQKTDRALANFLLRAPKKPLPTTQ